MIVQAGVSDLALLGTSEQVHWQRHMHSEDGMLDLGKENIEMFRGKARTFLFMDSWTPQIRFLSYSKVFRSKYPLNLNH